MLRSRFVAPLLVLLVAPGVALAQSAYRQPPEPIAQILDAAQTPVVSVSPSGATLLLLERKSLPPISEVAAPELRLAGVRINPRTRTPALATWYDGLRVQGVGGAGARISERRIEVPQGRQVGNVLWAPDGERVAFTVKEDSGTSLWVAEVGTAQARRITPATLNGVLGAPCRWVASASESAKSTRLVCRMIAARGAPPRGQETPTGPIIQESGGRAAPNRTYQDLLESPADEALFEHHFTSRIVLVSLDGAQAPIGDAGIHVEVEPSPSGEYLFVSTVHRPFSYVVPLSRFPERLAVWDMSGRMVKEIADLPLQEEVPISFDAVPVGPRDVSWRADAPATLVWAQALDEGNPARQAAKRDRLVALEVPFTGEPRTLIEVATRLEDRVWSRTGLAIVTESWWKDRRMRTWIVDPANPSRTPRLLFDRSSEDRYKDPGQFATMIGPRGTPLLLTTRDGRSAYLMGEGASAEGDRPFLDRIDLTSGQTQRLWRSEAPYYEQPVRVLDEDATRAITRRESVSEVPNYFVRDVRRSRLTQLTRFADPAPQLAGVTSELIRYKRADGVDLTARLYLPAGYDRSQGTLPFLFWAYPREFKSADAAAQTVGSPYRFTRPTGASHLFLLTQGYGVLDGPTMPIIGEGEEEPNDSYVEQLVASAKAAVDKVVELGVADRDRIAIGGHSYGAFMTANLLAHSDLFRAGIARSGAYNRTLTPFGFQVEERPYWQARDTYARMSPFTYADSVRAPILLIHGMEDNNSGTFPMQSERFFAALKGNGKVVRYVQLPAEAHGYRARESVGHTLWEMVTWLDTYVKKPVKERAE
ncbi:MAG TPA: prolyl oligopeptidase family serine peptidase [Gemmatimonadaceae bacterium]|nr:prolyl oligopeptidase family serine peptidase [Gemmatimonadaceae bacterium]